VKKKYGTVFPGKRDQYQIPIVLYEDQRLDFFITDIYKTNLFKFLFKFFGIESLLNKRFSKSLEFAKIEAYPFFSILNPLLKRIYPKSKVSVWEDYWFSYLAQRNAKKSKSSLILYEFQAEYAFKQKYNFPLRKILFQFHPHPIWEHPILLADATFSDQLYQEVLSNTRNNLPDRYKYHTYHSWVNADHVIVASGITKHSLVMAGCPEDKITIIPYGINTSEIIFSEVFDPPAEVKPFFLFVGSGSQRKGLHRLCNAWAHSELSNEFNLVVIARTVEPFLEDFLNKPGIKWIKGVDKLTLDWYYRNAICFVMPSLSEGFGQVYLEALSNGCPILGSRNSMLPDIPGGKEHILFIDPFNENEISKSLINIATKNDNDHFFDKISIKRLVIPYNWENFRDRIKIVLTNWD
jgi:glycosyltransferase involved in cell wall biosynthesis